MEKIKHKKVEYEGHVFDSQTEYEYYLHLKGREDVTDIVLQPFFTLMEAFNIECGRCIDGKVTSNKTGNLIKCKRCKGTGRIKRREWRYTADFLVVTDKGMLEVIDVKGWANERFPLVRKMFEYKYGHELLVVKKHGKGWRYV